MHTLDEGGDEAVCDRSSFDEHAVDDRTGHRKLRYWEFRINLLIRARCEGDDL